MKPLRSCPSSIDVRRASLVHASTFLLLLVVFIITYWAHTRGLPGAFLIDDSIRIEVKEVPSLDIATFARTIESTGVGLFGRPVSLASLFVTKFLYGNEPEAFKRENILLHLLTGALIFWCVYRLMQASRFHRWAADDHIRLYFALAVATIWLLHPIQISTVLYAVQRMTILSAVFAVAALLTYIIARQNPLTSVRSLLCLFFLTPTFTALSLLSKENGALIPIYLLIVELFAFGFYAARPVDWRILYLSTAVLVLIPLLLGLLYFITQTESLLYDYAVRNFTLTERLATQSTIVWQYVYFLVFPILSDMSLYHDAITLRTFSSPVALVATTGWIVVGALAVYFYSRQPIVSFGITLFLASQLLESTIIPLELMFEHRVYFGSIGVFLIVTHMILCLRNHLSHGPAVATTTLILVTSLLAFQSTTRAMTWKDHESLLVVTLTDHPESDRAAAELANLKLAQGRFKEARTILEKAIERPPHRARAGLRLHLLGTYCPSERSYPIELYNSVIQDLAFRPIQAYVLSGLNVLRELDKLDQCPQISRDEMRPLFRTAATNPKGRQSSKFRVNFLLGRFVTADGNFSEAVDAYKRALQYTSGVPDSAVLRVLIDLADVQIEIGHNDDARQTIRSAKALIDSSILKFPGASRAISNQLNVLESSCIDDTCASSAD